jgi:hypothetical protein
MATNTWQDIDGNWNNTANWSLAAVPVNGDDVIISSGSQDIDTNLDQSAVTLNSLRIGPSFSGKIGATGGSLLINGTDMDFESNATETWIDGTWSGNIVVNGGVSDVNMLQLDGDIDTLRVLGGTGTVTVAANAVLDNIEVIGRSARSVKVNILANVTSIDDVEVATGEVDIASAIAGTVTARGGELTLSGGTVNAINVEPGGTVIYTSSGQLTTLVAWGGTFDGTRITAGAVTMANCTIHEGASIDLRSGLRNWVLSNGCIYRGGKFFPPIGTTLTIT